MPKRLNYTGAALSNQETQRQCQCLMVAKEIRLPRTVACADCLRAVLFYVILLIPDLRYCRLADD